MLRNSLHPFDYSYDLHFNQYIYSVKGYLQITVCHANVEFCPPLIPELHHMVMSKQIDDSLIKQRNPPHSTVIVNNANLWKRQIITACTDERERERGKEGRGKEGERTSEPFYLFTNKAAYSMLRNVSQVTAIIRNASTLCQYI